MKQKPSKKTFMYAAILLLLSSILILVFTKKYTSSEVYAPINLDFSITPTPYPLPTQAYRSSSRFQTILGQLFRKREQIINPIPIIENGQSVAENPYINLYVENGFLPVDDKWWQQESETAYEYVRDRLNASSNDKIIVIFAPPKTGNCAPRGITFHEQQSIIVLFANENTSKEQILATFAHELGHVFIHTMYEDLTDVALSEGFATWAAGDYWTSWKGTDFNNGVKSYIKNGTYLPLVSNYNMSLAYNNDSPECIIHRDILLTELAAFIDYLDQSYGTEKLSRLFNIKQPETINNKRIIYPPNFKETFGLQLNQLEYLWLKSLNQSE